MTIKDDIQTAIETHRVLELFEMRKEAKVSKSHLWELFEKILLDIQSVNWMWETFGEYLREEKLKLRDNEIDFTYTLSGAYVLKLKMEGRLDESVEHFLIYEQPKLKEIADEKHKEFGIAKAFNLPLSTDTGTTPKPQDRSLSKAPATPTPQGPEPNSFTSLPSFSSKDTPSSSPIVVKDPESESDDNEDSPLVPET
ncbi:hypothetical protein K469DRAFT_694985 [Zopfia rhizophila CBS 207.26]|uniref:Uncharacterized protein n=1 Tax=Zopfia rhizophila CBS 207.26 TaxID=1314779 RepID=A0A6A6DJG3_9PEZI|nr:hypothetical protein K469DRAFT_694985 [Zopfia rhizophila CBS 207.26]